LKTIPDKVGDDLAVVVGNDGATKGRDGDIVMAGADDDINIEDVDSTTESLSALSMAESPDRMVF
jgi:hypothetical protein